MQFDKILKSATFYYLLFGIFSIIFLFKSYLSVDILGSDEVVYLNASNAIKIPFQDNYNGPIYAIWYYVITFFTQNFISTYYFNYFFLSVIPCFLLLVLLIKMGYNKAISLLITLLLLNSSFNLYLLPKISQLVVILIITALLFVKKAERIFNQFFIIGIFTLIIAYIRPEYYVAFGIAILLCYITFIIEYPKNSIFKKSDFYKLVILTSLAISFYLLLGGTPLSNRSFDAFVQHYIRNHCEQNGLIHPVSVHEEYKLFYEVYSKKPTSLLEAAFAEPTKFFWHVFTNLKNAVLKTVRIIYDIYLGGLFSLPAVLINISKVAILLFLLVIIDWRKSIQKLQFKTYLNVVFKTILLFFPILIGIVLVYPRDHYLVVLLAPIFVVISEIIAVIELRKFNKVDFNSRKNAVFQGFFLVLTLLLLLPVKTAPKTNYKLMYQLGQEISETTKLTLIDDYFSKIYYGDKITYVSISDYDNKQPFIDFVNGNGIQFIHTNNEQGLLQLNNNEGFKEFKDNFSNYGFKKINIKGDDDLLFIKNNLYATYLSEKHNF